MKIIFFYFSGTGNTKWVVKHIKSELEKRNHTVEAVNIEKRPSVTDISSFELIGLAHPVYGADMPEIVAEFLNYNIEIKNKIRIIISTFGYVNALGYFAERKRVNKNIKWYFNIRMFNNITTPELKSRVVSLPVRVSMKDDIEGKINRKIKLLLEKEKHIDGTAPYLAAGIFIRKMFGTRMKNHYQQLSVSLDMCIRCSKCVDDCPTGSISEVDGTLSFAGSCTACMRCYNRCPVNAILIRGKYADPELYPRYLNPWKD